jgi:hypothetical protein
MYKYDLANLSEINNSIADDISIMAYPNPFSGKLLLKINSQAASHYDIQLYNAQGVKITTIFEGYLNKGESTIGYNSANLANGIFICKITINKSLTKELKLMHLK